MTPLYTRPLIIISTVYFVGGLLVQPYPSPQKLNPILHATTVNNIANIVNY